MTKQEAMKRFGIGENDKVDRRGVESLIEVNKKLIKQTVSVITVRECEKEIEALKALLD